MGLSLSQSVAVHDLAKCTGELAPLVLQYVLLEMGGVDGIRIAQQQEVEVLFQRLDPTRCFGPEFEQHGVPGVLNLFDAGVAGAVIAQLQHEVLFVDFTALQFIEKLGLGAVPELPVKLGESEFGESAGGQLVIDLIQDPSKIEHHMLILLPIYGEEGGAGHYCFRIQASPSP